MAESPRGQGWTPSTEAPWGPLRAAPRLAPCHGQRCVYTATRGSAKWRPQLFCQNALAHSVAPAGGRLRGGP
eukprot:2829498-Alexandrium_andersonii.AAC.1